MKHMETWEAMELLGCLKTKRLPRGSTLALSIGEVKAIRIKYWCHKVTMSALAKEYKVSQKVISDCIRRKNAYESM